MRGVIDYIIDKVAESSQVPFSDCPWRETINKPATIQDVARAAAVSTATVSRALSRPERVSEDTRAAVAQAIQATGYRVNQAARNLRMQRAHAVLVMIPNLGKPFYSEILAGLSEGFAGSDYSLLITDTESRPLERDALAGYFADGRIDGAICLDGSFPRDALERCHAQGVGRRIVFMCEWVDGIDFPAVTVDNLEGARLAVRHLFDLGHRRLAFVAGPRDNVLTIARQRGMEEECAALGLPAPQIYPGDFSLESGRAAAEAMLTSEPRPTGVFASADTAAFGVIAGLRQTGGLRVPDDVSVVGFDDIEMAGFFDPALTTIQQDRRALGRRAARLLMDRMRGDASPGDVIPVRLIERGTTAPAP
ncbi:MAG: LacI family DNA-binding transcriptional regulator [Shimia sp.]